MNFTNLEKKIISHFAMEDVNGILLTGSYATKTQTEKSDIDIRIIFSDSKNNTIKGVKYIEGYKVSYFGENTSMVKKRMSIDFSRNSRFEARLFTLGKVLFDKYGQVEELIQYSKIFMDNNFPKKLTQDDVILRIYSLEVRYHSLLNISEKNPFYVYNYISFIKAILITYSLILNYETIIDIKPDKILFDNAYIKTNLWKKFPDSEFIDLWIKCLEDINPENAKLIYEYIQTKTLIIEKKDFEVIYRD